MRPVKSKVVPDGTATAEIMIVEQEVLDLLAEEAPPDPENVQVVARLLISGAAVGSGNAAAIAMAAPPITRARERRTMAVLFLAGTMSAWEMSEKKPAKGKAYLCHATPTRIDGLGSHDG